MYVFKTSKLKVNIAHSMGNKDHFLSNEYCHTDGKSNSCTDSQL